MYEMIDLVECRVLLEESHPQKNPDAAVGVLDHVCCRGLLARYVVPRVPQSEQSSAADEVI